MPTTQQLSLAATLVVHPSQTTRAAPTEANRAANDALRLLRQVNTLVGPVNGNFATALTFPSSKNGRLRAWRSNPQMSNTRPDERGPGSINTEIATTGSIWHRADDFWHVVGWAFNCSVAWKNRWERWRLWLDFMLDALNHDFDERLKQAKQVENSHDAQDVLGESLVLQYLFVCDTRTARRRLMRAVFANGDAKSLNEFKQMFKNENKERRPKEASTVDGKSRKLNIDEGEFADYVDDDEDDDEVMGDVDAPPSENQPMSTSDTARRASIITIGSSSDESEWSGSEANHGLDSLGDMDSILLRQRLLSLVR